MQIDDFNALTAAADFSADLVIIGGGPAGLTIAREFFGSPVRVLVLESGAKSENTAHSALNTVESIGDPQSPAQLAKRRGFHAVNAAFWKQDEQPFGVRCRTLGGSTAAWAGKSAAFDSIDFAKRPWVPHSGWPITREALNPYLDRAAAHLNLGPNVYDDGFWAASGGPAPKPQFDPSALRSFFWQFARSRIDAMDLMRFGPEFERETAANVRVLTNATVTEILTTADGGQATGAAIASLEGKRGKVHARAVVLAASGIENPRLLLASRAVRSEGLGNAHGQVGRYLMDHPGARIAHFEQADVARLAHRFGFYALSHEGRAHMYMHGLALSPDLQEREGLLNCALYMMEERSPDDPWDAIKRLLKLKSKNPAADAWAVAKSPWLLAKGLGMKAFQSRLLPGFLKNLIVNLAVKANPNFVAQEFLSRGLPHKLIGLNVDAICEQSPNPESRITLSDRLDPMGVPLARVDWKLDPKAGASLIRLAKLIEQEFPKAGLPKPILEPWVQSGRVEDAAIIDMAHTVGATRMAADPREGVVDPHCQVHGVQGLFVAGGSVFPTSGHANPTLMILSLAIRLADHLKTHLGAPR
jgi:choline dehydrogenase-like flavoprotein